MITVLEGSRNCDVCDKDAVAVYDMPIKGLTWGYICCECVGRTGVHIHPEASFIGKHWTQLIPETYLGLSRLKPYLTAYGAAYYRMLDTAWCRHGLMGIHIQTYYLLENLRPDVPAAVVAQMKGLLERNPLC